MLARGMLTLRYRLRVDDAKANSILMSYLSNLEHYAFMDIQPKNVGTGLKSSVEGLESEGLRKFLECVRGQLQLFSALKTENYGHRHLLQLDEGDTIRSQILAQNRQTLKEAKKLYLCLIDTIKTNANADNFMLWIDVCLKLQIIQVQIWSIFVRLTLRHFPQLSKQHQVTNIKHFSQYINTYFMKYTYSPSKFVYRENSLADLGNLYEMFLLYIDVVLRWQPSGESSSSFSLVIQLLLKCSKTVLVNFNTFLQHYLAHESLYLRLLRQSNKQALLCFLMYYSVIGISHPEMMRQINSKMGQLFQQQPPSQEEMLNVLNSWSSLSTNSTQLYKTHFKPLLAKMLTKQGSQSQLTTMLFNLICCGIEDQAFFELILVYITDRYPIDSKIVHMIRHYMNLSQKILTPSSHPHCRQHSATLKIIEQNGVSFSNCMLRRNSTEGRNEDEIRRQVSYHKQEGIEHNKPQQFWLFILKQVFDDLSVKYPHKDNQIYFNYQFCVFQIDALVCINGVYIAFELAGTHYLHKSVEKGAIESSQGKKKVKKRIVEAYGVKVCEIKSWGLIERTVSAFQDKIGGGRYLRAKLEQILTQK